jgi:hypothetical protein
MLPAVGLSTIPCRRAGGVQESSAFVGLRKTWQAIQFGISLAHSQGLIFHGQFSVVWGLNFKID